MIELRSLNANATFTVTPGGGGDIIGMVDNATYTDGDPSNSATQIAELNETYSSNGGTFTIDGVNYNFRLAVPDGSGNDVTVTYNDGASSINIGGNGGSSNVAFVVLSPLGGGSDRYFALFDDSIGDLPNITSIQIRGLDLTPAGDDVMIDLGQDNLVTACFAAGTMIATATGPYPVENLAPGDRVLTLDHGPRPITWMHCQQVKIGAGKRAQRHRPVLVQRGALGAGLPERNLWVSPQHRMVVASKIAERMFQAPEVLVPAIKLVGLPGISQPDATSVTYCHLYFGSHEIVLADGAPSESLLPERQALNALPKAARRSLGRLLGDYVAPARPIIAGGPILREFLRRHRKNLQPLCDPRLRAGFAVAYPPRLVAAQ